MPKRSKADTEQTKMQILDEAFEQILSVGYESMSYTSLSQATGISRTGISHHFPKKADFLSNLDGRISDHFCDGLNFSSIETLEQSWLALIEHTNARAVLKLFFSLCAANKQITNSFNTVNDIRQKAQDFLGGEGCVCIDRLIGQSAMIFFINQSVTIETNNELFYSTDVQEALLA